MFRQGNTPTNEGITKASQTAPRGRTQITSQAALLLELVLMNCQRPTVGVLITVACTSLALQADQVRSARDIVRDTPNPTRRALTIGNDRYPAAPLRQAVNDASDIGRLLQRFGFDVQTEVNITGSKLTKVVDDFIQTIRPGDTALFFFAGHGFQLSGENYLVPVDFAAKDLADARFQAYSVARLHDRMTAAGAGASILLLDACRNNPFISTRDYGGGLAGVNGGLGTFIALATSPGKLAFESPAGRNSIFTRHLLSAMQEPGLTLDQIFSKVREGVYIDSSKQQLPWTSSSMVGEFRFHSSPKSQLQHTAHSETPTESANPLVSSASVTPIKAIGDAVMAPRALYTPSPQLKWQRTFPSPRSVVTLHLVVATDGTVQHVEILKGGNKDHESAALATVKQWRFEPGLKGGQPTVVNATVEMKFNMLAQDLISQLAPPDVARIGAEDVSPPKVRTRTLPVFPNHRRRRGHYWVSLYAIINESGVPTGVRLLGGPISAGTKDEADTLLILTERAIQSFSQWRFFPAEKMGKPISVATSAQFVFAKGKGQIQDIGADFFVEVH